MDGMTIGYVSERNARRWPDREAVVYREDGARAVTRTFAEFDDRTDRLATGLADRGVEKGDAVALYMKNNAETLETFMGTMKLGALVVPVNHRFKGDEVRYVLEDSDATVCLVDDFGAETLADIRDAIDHVVTVSDRPSFAESYEQVLAEEGVSVDADVGRQDEAGIMYTSGTTGDPKGCIYTHDNLVQLMQDAAEAWAFLAPGNRHLVSTPLFHVGAFIPFLNNFYVGGATVVVDGFDAERTLALVEDERVNSTYLVPTQTRMLLDLDSFEDYDVSTLNTYSTGAAPVGADLKRATIERFDCDVLETFGQTEALCLHLLPEDAIEKADSVGEPMLNLGAKVVGEDGDELPPGEIGRIAYRGPTVFDRYHDMPEKTDAVFDDGWFVSDDLVHRDEDGFFHFVGRADDMLITGGENVHPAEIEEVLHGHSDVGEVAVVGVPDDEWGEAVKACVVPVEGASLSEDDVVRYVASRLADFKKPRQVEFYDELPRNPTGKVLKSELT
ncbi:class I adenylate-forming enzyme family protein [Halomarina halobia]|uniref:Class I adenylate-forming enzyme family protein n=1 Tax=Halomarina halobia TaxID=3033386 RepID=A0ABD6ACY4_9EURY|nr:AMP-binding protein [Halomarina sp. PSR21]